MPNVSKSLTVSFFRNGASMLLRFYSIIHLCLFKCFADSYPLAVQDLLETLSINSEVHINMGKLNHKNDDFTLDPQRHT